MAVELATCSVLEDDVDSAVVEEEAVHFKDVLVAEMGMDLDLSSQLINDSLILNLLFRKHFQSDDHFGFTLARQIYMSIPTSWKSYFPFPIWRPI